MAEYIEKETVLEIVNNLDDRTALVVGRKVVNLPAADVVPVVRGAWEFSHTSSDGFAIVKCSNCGHEAFAIAIYVREGHYCPNCGAKMGGNNDA